MRVTSKEIYDALNARHPAGTKMAELLNRRMAERLQEQEDQAWMDLENASQLREQFFSEENKAAIAQSWRNLQMIRRGWYFGIDHAKPGGDYSVVLPKETVMGKFLQDCGVDLSAFQKELLKCVSLREIPQKGGILNPYGYEWDVPTLPFNPVGRLNIDDVEWLRKRMCIMDELLEHRRMFTFIERSRVRDTWFDYMVMKTWRLKS